MDDNVKALFALAAAVIFVMTPPPTVGGAIVGITGFLASIALVLFWLIRNKRGY